MVSEIYETEHVLGIAIMSFDEYVHDFNRPTTDVQTTRNVRSEIQVLSTILLNP